MIPKVKFYIRRPEEDIESINHFLDFEHKRNWDWSNIIFKFYPELKSELDEKKTIYDKKVASKNFVEDFFKKNKDLIGEKGDEFEKEWKKINDKYMNTLSEVLEIKWPKKDKEIRAILSLNPISPRWIQGRSFDIYYNFNIKIMKATVMHESLHFLWFEKWKEIFPETDEKEFDSPHLVWKLSEMVTKAILSDERIQRVFKHKPLVYDEWKFAKINGKPLLSQIGKFYYEKKDFADFVKKSWKFIKKYEKEINKI